MKVKELIEKLSQLPQELPVIVSGYESGYNEVICAQNKKVKKAINPSWYDGKLENATGEDDDPATFDSVYLGF